MLVGTATPELIETAPGSGRVGVIQKPCLDRTLIDRVLSLRAEGMAGMAQSPSVGRTLAWYVMRTHPAKSMIRRWT